MVYLQGEVAPILKHAEHVAPSHSLGQAGEQHLYRVAVSDFSPSGAALQTVNHPGRGVWNIRLVLRQAAPECRRLRQTRLKDVGKEPFLPVVHRPDQQLGEEGRHSLAHPAHMELD